MRPGRSYLLHKPKPSRKKRRFLLLVIAAMLLALSIFLAINIITTFNSFHNSEPWAQALREQGLGNEIVYLIYGIDFWGANPYVERVILLHHDVAGDNVSLVYMPGNTMVTVDERGPEPLGQIYRRLQDRDFIAFVSEFTGLPVHHYFALRYEALAVLGDHLGGVEALALAGESAGGLLPSGEQRLRGFEIYRYFLTANYRESPWEQVERQRQTLLQLWYKLENKKAWQWPRLLNLLAPYVETDLSWRELSALQERFAEHAFDDIRLILLPGAEEIRDNCLYWVTDAEGIREIVRMLNEGYLVKPEEVKVEVLNGSGITGMAAEVAALLKEEGFNVVRTDNADRSDYEETLVIASGDVVDKARAVALFVPGSSMLHRYDPEAAADVTVIVGRSYTLYRDGRD